VKHSPEIRKVYHVTLEGNTPSILAHGVSPMYSAGKAPLCWFVDGLRLSWAIAHISARHKVSADALVVCTVWAGHEYFRRTKMTGVFTASKPLFAYSVVPAMSLLRPDPEPS
jgi:hypothetical protein